MNRFSVAALLAAAALAGCNLTYDREGLEFGSASKDREPNDTMATAVPMTLGGSHQGTLGSETDVDYFKFTVTVASEVAIQTFDANGATCDAVDPEIAVYDASGNMISSDDDGGIGYCENLQLPSLAPGTYYVAVMNGNQPPLSGYEPPTNYLLRTTASPVGGTWTTVGCNYPDDPMTIELEAFCAEVTGTMGASAVASFMANCSYYSGTYRPDGCLTAGTVVGYCDVGPATDYGADATQRWLYDSAKWAQAPAESDCRMYSGVWVNGPCGGTISTCDLGQGGGTYCANLQNDPNNCNACGYTCEIGATCVGGGCVGGGQCGNVVGHEECYVGQANACVDTLNDPHYCGGCTAPYCAGTCAGGVCSAGTCVDISRPNGCDLGFGLQCVDLQSDRSNCGSCGVVCAGSCSNGGCTDPGPCSGPEFLACGQPGSQTCVDQLTDPNNCGGCLNPCGTMICGMGSCLPPERPEEEPNDDPSMAPMLALGQTLRANFVAGERDYFQFMLPTTMDVTLSTRDQNGSTCNMAHPAIDVFDSWDFAWNTEVAWEDARATPTCQDLTVTLPPGTYLVQVTGDVAGFGYLLRTSAAPPSRALNESTACMSPGNELCQQAQGPLSPKELDELRSQCAAQGWIVSADGLCPPGGYGRCDLPRVSWGGDTMSSYFFYPGYPGDPQFECENGFGGVWTQ